MKRKILVTGASSGFGRLITKTLLKQGPTVVDQMGMGDPIQGYNERQEQITRGIYKALGIENMLALKMIDA